MRIPFDSLDSTTWLAFSDYSAEIGKEKVAKYAARVGEALEKFHRRGVPIGLGLMRISWDYERDFVMKGDLLLTSRGSLCMKKERWVAWTTDPHKLYWVPTDLDGVIASPLDLPEWFRWDRPIRKFFSTVADRAKRLKL